jgi:hypothetical protein
MGNGFPPEVRENWVPITAAFVVPLICGIALKGTTGLRPGAMFMLGLFVGLFATTVAMVVTVVRAHR